MRRLPVVLFMGKLALIYAVFAVQACWAPKVSLRQSWEMLDDMQRAFRATAQQA